MLSALDILQKRFYCEISNKYYPPQGGTINNKLLAAICIIIVVTLGVIYVRGQQSSDKQMMPAPTETMEKTEDSVTKPTGEMMEGKKQDDSVKKDEGAMMQNESRYVVYSKAAFDGAKGKKRVYFFHAPWCPTCRPADAAFQKDSALIPESVVLFKTDYDSSTDLKKQYNVTYQHTFVQVDDSGREVTKWNGGDVGELTKNVK